MKTFDDRSAGEQRFIKAYTKQLLVKWADEQLRPGGVFTVLPHEKLYHEYAKAHTKWIKKSNPYALTGAGFLIAASTCKASTGGGGWRPS